MHPDVGRRSSCRNAIGHGTPIDWWVAYARLVVAAPRAKQVRWSVNLALVADPVADDKKISRGDGDQDLTQGQLERLPAWQKY